jgi:hypothetical protein
MTHEQITWNAAIDTALKEIAVQSMARHLPAYSPEYLAACQDCFRRLTRLREPQVTAQQVAEMMIGMVVGR